MNTNEMTFGVEIECYIPAGYCHGYSREVDGRLVPGDVRVGGYKRGIQVPALDQGWKAESDSSISNHTPPGFVAAEIVSPVLVGEGGVESLKKTLRWLREVGARVNRACGLHIHVGFNTQAAGSLEGLRKLVAAVARYELGLKASTGTHSRDANSFCKSVKENRVYKQKVAMASRFQLDSDFEDRYHVLNLSNLLRGGKPTVEFRVFAGTTNMNKVLGYLELCLGLVQRAMATERPCPVWDDNRSMKQTPGVTSLRRLFNHLRWNDKRSSHYGRILNNEDHRAAVKKLLSMAEQYDAPAVDAGN